MNSNELFDASFANADLIESIYQTYSKDPSKVDPSWKNYFEGITQIPTKSISTADKEPKAQAVQEVLLEGPTTIKTVYVTGASDIRVFNLIEAYRAYGHLMANFNPIRTDDIPLARELDPLNLGFSKEEFKKPFPTCGLLEKKEASLEEIIAVLKEIYCDKIGVEYTGLQQPELEKWLQERIEPTRFKSNLTMEQKQLILQHLNKSELFESFLHTKYVGQKRFSLEGGETLIPMLAVILESGSKVGLKEAYIGMSHRGRLNVLTNILNKSYSEVFGEFDESYIPDSFEGSGDVKYHKGFFSTVTTVAGHQIKLTLTDNPSHLESVDPVVEGQVRARQVQTGDEIKMESVVPILIHGDAAISGQGIVYETLQLSKLPGYQTGGTIHLVVNNQIGFTTLPKDSRSTRYCTDIARAFSSPIFHVNAEDPEGCIFVTNLAIEIRQKFHCDVFIDLNCYRKYGHNEGDEPAYTQPLEYQMISKKRPIREIYRDDLINQGVLEKYMAETLEEEFKKALQRALKETKVFQKETDVKKAPPGTAALSRPPEMLFEVVQTNVELSELKKIAEKICEVPENFSINKKLEKQLEDRLKMFDETTPKPVDWGMAEALAFGSLLTEGFHVRLSGQDSRRGTFSHRHATWIDQMNAKKYFPLSHLQAKQGRFDVFNSPLSEYGVLGFEFGYSMTYPNSLVIWEAQFGDFCNGAQIIIDQYIATAEQKWGQKVGLTLLLPHGFEGQGPEHSSGRIERFMGLCGNYNMQVVNLTTPAQFFHLLRRQAKRLVVKPLIVFSPKGLLRHPECTSNINELTTGSFQEILDDPQSTKKEKRLIFCSGRVYYDLIAGRARTKTEDMAFIRIEQLYPLNMSKLKEIVNRYPAFNECFWVQEEPSNMGAWKFMRPLLMEICPTKVAPKYIGRAPSASPATGSHARHKKELSALINAVFAAQEQPFYEIAFDKSSTLA